MGDPRSCIHVNSQPLYYDQHSKSTIINDCDKNCGENTISGVARGSASALFLK
jgi:hypothetical protein